MWNIGQLTDSDLQQLIETEQELDIHLYVSISNRNCQNSVAMVGQTGQWPHVSSESNNVVTLILRLLIKNSLT